MGPSPTCFLFRSSILNCPHNSVRVFFLKIIIPHYYLKKFLIVIPILKMTKLTLRWLLQIWQSWDSNPGTSGPKVHSLPTSLSSPKETEWQRVRQTGCKKQRHSSPVNERCQDIKIPESDEFQGRKPAKSHCTYPLLITKPKGKLHVHLLILGIRGILG